MSNKSMVSVCLTTYNGEKYIEDQLLSILNQLSTNDEVIIVDDCSVDNTISIINSIKDSRIKLIINKINVGAINSFQKSIINASGGHIFLSDQDDIWYPNRLNLLMDSFKSNYLVSGNTIAVDETGKFLNFELGKLEAKNSSRSFKNIFNIFIGKAYYYGCAMGFSSKLIKFILPFPSFIESHDLWIALVANILKRNFHLEQIVLLRRIHGKNLSLQKRPLFKKVLSRFITVYSLTYAIFRVFLIKIKSYEKKT
jgi:glycosyltransferase involved in cell wall biosynthesis